jgi:hypothetical protein
MPLNNPFPYNEKILAIGNFGCGKSTGWLQIAQRAQATKSDAQFYVLDTDDATGRMVAANPLYASLDNLHITPAYEFPEYQEFISKTRAKARPHDWVVVDFIDAAWDSVQSYFTEEVFKKDIGEYFLQVRKGLKSDKSLSAFEGWTDWQVINKLYADFANPLFKRTRANIYATAKLAKVGDDEKDRGVRSLFGAAGVKPTGQKHLGFQFHTILVFSSISSGSNKEYTITTIKDREREEMRGEKWTNFVSDYLVKRAGWKMV